MQHESYDADELGQYRSLSTLSVVAFVLGLCSVLAFVSPLVLIVPLAAVAIALLALRGIVLSGGGLTGARLARTGLALAILFGVASLARVKARDYLLQRQAESVAREWLSLAAEGRAEDMLSMMTKSAATGLTLAVEPGEQMPFFGGILASALIRHDPLVAGLMQLRTDAGLELKLREADVFAKSRPPQTAFRYTAGVAGTNQLDCMLVLNRYEAPQQERIWLVDSWTLE